MNLAHNMLKSNCYEVVLLSIQYCLQSTKTDTLTLFIFWSSNTKYSRFAEATEAIEPADPQASLLFSLCVMFITLARFHSFESRLPLLGNVCVLRRRRSQNNLRSDTNVLGSGVGEPLINKQTTIAF